MSAFLELHLTFQPAEPGRDIALALLSECGFDTFREEGPQLWAYAAVGSIDEASLEEVRGALTEVGLAEWAESEVPEANWNAVWESEYEPVHFGTRAILRAPFHVAPPSGLDVVIRPEMSFGTGHHPTTRLMMEMLLDHVPAGLRVLDMGAGTGVLAIAAALLGAERCLAVEIESGAADNARSNVDLNAVHVRVEVRCGDAGCVLPEDGPFDRVLANINRNVLTQDWPSYDRFAARGAQIVTSGFFPSDVETLTARASKFGWHPVEQRVHEGWACVRWDRMELDAQ